MFFLKKLIKIIDASNLATEYGNDIEESNMFLNHSFTRDEIFKAIKGVQNNKAPGDDHLINEYIYVHLLIL